MKRRENRLQAILELVAARPEGAIDEGKLIGRMCAEYAVAPATVRLDLEDLSLRGWVTHRFGVLRLTPVGARAAGHAVPPAKGQKTIEAGEAGTDG